MKDIGEGWKLRATAAIVIGIFMTVWLVPLPTVVEVILLIVGLMGAAAYASLHRRQRAADGTDGEVE